MDKHTLTQVGENRNIEASGAIYTEIAHAAWRYACLNEAPEEIGWRFRVENGLVFARNGGDVEYLVDGVPARFILEMEVYNESL